MGGLTALCVADDRQVEAVVALAPWLNRHTPVKPVAGRRVLIVHGADDRWTSPANSLDYARRADGVAASVDYVALSGAGHFMVRRLALWNTLATGFVLDAFGKATGADVSGATAALHNALRRDPSAAGTRMPVVL
jgi:dienelactone hydrolase